jgi:hypothetical protein
MTDTPATPQQPSRLLSFDFLRGYFLVAIILNHLYWYPNGLDWVSAQGSLFVTAAEGFFLLSGIILGIIRGRKLLAEPFKKGARLLLNRGVQLYVTSIVLFFVFTLLGWWFFLDNPGLKAGIRPVDQPIWEVIWGALTYEYIYGWADFLRLYAIFLIVSPIALFLLRIKKWYLLLVLSISTWALFPLASQTLPYSDELLMPIAWQLIFFGGLTIGFYWHDMVRWWNERTIQFRRLVTSIIVSLSVITILANVILAQHAVFSGAAGGSLQNIHQALLPYFDKASMSPARLLLFLLWISFGFWLVQHFQKFAVKWLGWILIPFGSNSLYVYIVHAFLVFFAHLLAQGNIPTFIVSFLGSIVVLGLTLLAVRTKFLMRIIPR